MLLPKKQKYRKQFRGTMKGISTRGAELEFGQFGLKSQGRGWVTSRQIEAARKAITHYTKKGGRLWIRIFPDKPISKKPPETRMGSGKGDNAEYVAVVKPGRIMFEMGGVSQDIARSALLQAGHRLPMRTKIVCKD